MCLFLYKMPGLLLPDKSDQKQQHQRTDYRSNNVIDQTAADVYAQLLEQPTTDKSAENTNYNVPQQTKTITLTDKPSQPTGCSADNESENKRVQFHIEYV
jgi:hypothetical protein